MIDRAAAAVRDRDPGVDETLVGGQVREARRPKATGHSSSTQARNPASVEAGAR